MGPHHLPKANMCDKGNTPPTASRLKFQPSPPQTYNPSYVPVVDISQFIS